MKKLICTALLALSASATAFAGLFSEVYPHELMFINCTNQEVQVSNGDTLPYKFSMDPLFEARNDYSPSYTFTIPTNTVAYKHPITIFSNWRSNGTMKMYLTGGVNSEINVSLVSNEYIVFKTDLRFVTMLGYNNVWQPRRGNRSIIGLGCESNTSFKTNGTAGTNRIDGVFQVMAIPPEIRKQQS